MDVSSFCMLSNSKRDTVFRCTNKIRVDGQKLKTKAFVFEFSKLELNFVASFSRCYPEFESYEGSNCTVLEQYLEFFGTTKTTYSEMTRISWGFEFRFIY